MRQVLVNGVIVQMDRRGQVTGYAGGLKGSTQHWPAVYPPECEIPTFVAAVDSAVKRSRPDPTASSGLGPPSSADIAAIAHSCFRSIRAARDFVDRRSKPAHRSHRASNALRPDCSGATTDTTPGRHNRSGDPPGKAARLFGKSCSATQRGPAKWTPPSPKTLLR